MNNTNKIIKDHGLDENGGVTQFLRDTVDRFCDPYIPMDRGTLKNTKVYPNNHSIKYVSPYARYMYKGKSFNFQGAPKRGAEWDKRMMNDHRREIIKDVQKFIKSGNQSKGKSSIISTVKKTIRVTKNPSSLLRKYKAPMPKFVNRVNKYSKKMDAYQKKFEDFGKK